MEADLNKNLKKKIITIRGFYSGKELRFGSDGGLQKPASTGCWTADGRAQVERIKLRPGEMVIEAKRLAVVFRDDGTEKLVERGDNVRLRVELPAGEPDEAEILNLLKVILVSPNEDLTALVPEFWWPFLRGELKRDPPFMHVDDAVSRVTAGVKPPRVLSPPNPEYSPPAKAARYQGTTVFWVVVDETGKISKVAVVRPAGFGLDEKALEALRRWRFEPGQRDGKPVAVQINVEINFRLY